MKIFANNKMNNFLITSAFILAGSIVTDYAVTPNAYAFGIGVQPSTVEMTIKPGDRQRQVITVGNVHKTKTISMTIGLADWTLDEQGQLVLSPPGETERSAADWIRFSPASVTLKPETSMDVIVEISAPYKMNTKGDHRFALLATTLLPELDERGDVSGVWNRYQLASLFYLTVTPSKSTPKVTSVAFNSDEDSKSITMKINNDGDAHARLKGMAFIKDNTGEVVTEFPLSTVVLDGGKRDYTIKLEGYDDLKPGEKYSIDFDMKNSFVPQNRFKVTTVDVPSVGFETP
jgi:hypothetical protein